MSAPSRLPASAITLLALALFSAHPLVAPIAIALAEPAPLRLDSRISDVTLFEDRAQVTRAARAQLAGREGHVVLEGLPLAMDPASLRIRAQGPTGLVLGAVDVEPLRGREAVRDEERRLLAAIAAREEARQAIDDRLSSLALQLLTVEGLAREPGGEAGLPPERWEAWLERLERTASPLHERRSAARRERVDVDEEIARLRRELEDLGQGERDSYRVRIAWRSPADGEAEFAIDYQVGNAGWQSVYELRLDTASDRLTLLQQAEIRQDTGEDWDAVALTLSTARPALGGQLPELRPRYLDVGERPTPGVRRARGDTLPDAAFAEMLAAAPDLATAGDDRFAAEWQLSGPRSVRAGAASQRHALQHIDLDADVSARSVPARSRHAWLYAAASYTGESPLPTGRALLFQDGVFVGQRPFAATVPGTDLNLSFGVDQRIEVVRRLVEDERGTEGLVRRQNRHVRSWVIEVHNGHDRPIRLSILDQLPVARDERIRVELARDSTAPDERDVDGRPGIVAWHRDYAAGAGRPLRFGYVVTWPQDAEPIHGL